MRKIKLRSVIKSDISVLNEMRNDKKSLDMMNAEFTKKRVRMKQRLGLKNSNLLMIFL